MASYNWAQAVRDWLVDDISKKQRRLTAVTGCTIILLTNMEPRFLRWDLSKLTSALSNVDFDDAIVSDIFLIICIPSIKFVTITIVKM
ncbi:hypothetical protein LguiA_028747 [Lonicera macranthoides]